MQKTLHVWGAALQVVVQLVSQSSSIEQYQVVVFFVANCRGFQDQEGQICMKHVLDKLPKHDVIKLARPKWPTPTLILSHYTLSHNVFQDLCFWRGGPPAVESSIAVEDAIENRGLYHVFCTCFKEVLDTSTTIAQLSPLFGLGRGGSELLPVRGCEMAWHSLSQRGFYSVRRGEAEIV